MNRSLFISSSQLPVLKKRGGPRVFGDALVCSATRQRRSENTPGNIFVDQSCIDCDTCRWFAPNTFSRIQSQSAVHTQPQTEEQNLQALQAMVACPTGSIRTEQPDPLARQAASSFPVQARSQNGQLVEDVYYNGYTSKNTFGASSWIITSPEIAVIFDCPRFSEKLAKNIEHIVGRREVFLVLSHRDDVYGHDQWAKRFNSPRIIHASECNESQMTDACEIKLIDSQFPYALAKGFTLIHTPGHTTGSLCLLHKASKSLFSGDHIFYSVMSNGLGASRQFCSYDWEVQRKSILRLADLDFKYIWPGHGRRAEFRTPADMRSQIEQMAKQM